MSKQTEKGNQVQDYRERVRILRKNPPKIELKLQKLIETELTSPYTGLGVVYSLRCQKNGRQYIGITSSFEFSTVKKVFNKEFLNLADFSRWESHLIDLTAGNHGKKDLQHDWNQYGINCFSFEVLDVIQSCAYSSVTGFNRALSQSEAYFHQISINNYSWCKAKYKGDEK